MLLKAMPQAVKVTRVSSFRPSREVGPTLIWLASLREQATPPSDHLHEQQADRLQGAVHVAAPVPPLVTAASKRRFTSLQLTRDHQAWM